MRLIDCSEDEVKELKNQFDLTLNWHIVVCPKKIVVGEETVGLIDFSEGMFGENSLDIDSFEVFEKRSGIGSEIIQKLLKIYPKKDFYLYPDSQESKVFWEKNNFKTIGDGTGETEIYYYSNNFES